MADVEFSSSRPILARAKVTVELTGGSPMSDAVARTIDYFTVDGAGAIAELRVELC